MDSNCRTDNILPYLDDLKISAFKKVELIKDQIQNVTIGPASVLEEKNITKMRSVSVEQKKGITGGINEYVASENSTEASKSNEANSLFPFRQVLKEYEFSRQQKVQEAIQSHHKKFELFSTQQNMNQKHYCMIQQQKHNEKMQLFEDELMIALKKYDEEKQNEQKIINQYQQMMECKKKKIAEAIEAKKKETELLNVCLNNQSEFQTIFRQIMLTIMHCKDDTIKESFSESWSHCKELNDLMAALIEKSKEKSSEEVRDMIEMVLKRIKELQGEINNIILNNDQQKVEVNNSANGDRVVRDKEPAIGQKEEYTISSPQTQLSTPPEEYTELMQYHQKYVDSLGDFLHIEGFKQFRFDCKKAVNLSVNTISAASSQHLHDKYIKLSNLLSGKKAVIGDLEIIASRHPKGVPYCIDLLAKKFVLQGDLMVSCNPESAFAFATVIVSIWNECPDFGRILVSYFYKECVYLVPFHPQKVMNQTDQDYYSSQGYRYIDGKVEEQDKFLKRMAGTMRLYFAILISSPRRNDNRHPFFINQAWVWLVRALKLKPMLDITATMFHTFFETIGFEMQKFYGRQFLKVINYFMNIYFPLMKEIDSGGPVTRLECLMLEFKENGNKFKAPKGVLSENFW